jgi:hypothetical protein
MPVLSPERTSEEGRRQQVSPPTTRQAIATSLARFFGFGTPDAPGASPYNPGRPSRARTRPSPALRADHSTPSGLRRPRAATA